MPQIVYTPKAYRDFERLNDFLLEVAPDKVGEAMGVIFDRLDILQHMPLAGSLVSCEALSKLNIALRKFVIPYGKSGYVALYTYDMNADKIIVETIRHMRELEPEFLIGRRS